MRGKPLTQEDWDKVHLLDSKRVFTTQQLANITGLSVTTINNIKQYASFEEYQIVRLGAMKLSAKRKAEREKEAKEAYESAQRELSGEDAFDAGVKLDIIIEKLDTIIKLFGEDVATRVGSAYQSDQTFNNNKAPF